MGQVSLVHKLHHLDVILIFNYHVFIRIIMVLVSGKRVNLGSGECTKLSLVWNQLTTSSCFEACDVHGTSSVSYQEWRSIASYQKFSISLIFVLLLKRMLQHVGHQWVISGLLCGSTGVTHFQPWSVVHYIRTYKYYWKKSYCSYMSCSS